MASLFRKTVTRPLPKGAEITNRKAGPVATWCDRNGRKQTAPLVLDDDSTPKLGKDGKPRIRTKSATVYAKVAGIGDAIPTGCRTEDAARYKLAELVKRAEHIASGILTDAEARTADHQTTPLSEHIAAYCNHLKARNVTPRRIKQNRSRLERVAGECEWKLLSDLSGTGLESWLTEKRDTAEMYAANWNDHRGTWIAFANWMKRKTVGRLVGNPFTGVPLANERADPRRKRRAMTEGELVRLLKVARLRPAAEFGRDTVKLADADIPNDAKSRAGWTKAPLSFATLDVAVENGRKALRKRPDFIAELEARGRERALLYKLLVLTGLRKGELASLTVGQCELASRMPHITLNAADEKNREGNTVPLRADLTADLSRHLAGRLRVQQRAAKAASRPIPLRLSPTEKLVYVPTGLVRILNRDLEAAGIPKRDDRGRTLDVHALRTTFGSLLSRAGVPLRTAQAAMRHSDPSLTANVYTDPRLLDVSGAVESLPELPLDDAPNTEHQRKTGTTDSGAVSVAPTVALNAGNLGQCLANTDTRGNVDTSASPTTGTAVSAGFVDGKHTPARDDNGGETGRQGTRTPDFLGVNETL